MKTPAGRVSFSIAAQFIAPYKSRAYGASVEFRWFFTGFAREKPPELHDGSPLAGLHMV